MIKSERRTISAAYRALTNRGNAQYRALDRLESLAGEEAALSIYFATNPNLPPGSIEQWIHYRIAGLSPFRDMPLRSML